MNTFQTITITIVCFAASAQARIGESIEACHARYGKPVQEKFDEVKTGTASFDKNDLRIELHFTKGYADLIRYNPGQIARIDLETAEYLINLNGRNKEWKQLNDEEEGSGRGRRINDVIFWQTRDKMIEANFSISRARLEIKAVMMQERIREGL